jgi:photosystem I reaction center subunit XII
MLSDNQIVIALFTSLVTGILAVRLGIQLYEY